jgi:hypothetical protein
LQALDSTSATAIYRMLITIVGLGHWHLEKLWDQFKAELKALLARNVYGTLPWYVNEAKQFQYNANVNYYLELNEFFEAVYTVDAPQDQIIAFAAASENVQAAVPIVSVKVAKADSNGRPKPLAQLEYDAFEQYLQRKKAAGVRTEVISLPPDRILPTMEVTYDALGDPATLRQALYDAMTDYLYSLPFDGEIFFERLRDAAQAVEGVVEVNILSCIVTANNGLQTVDLKAQRRLRLPAGYIDWDAAWDNDYASSNSQYLTLIPDS